MTREIKFRGKRLDNGEWVTGSHTLIQDADGVWLENKDLDIVKVDPATVGQFTGEFDYYGKEIYEGDFVVYPECVERGYNLRPIYARTPHEVWFDEGCFWLIPTDRAANDPLPLYNINGSSNPEVRGNKHDNPKILR